MAVTGLAVAKGLAIAAGVVGTTVATAHVVGLTNALSHVPTWTHAHTVISSLLQKRQ